MDCILTKGAFTMPEENVNLQNLEFPKSVYESIARTMYPNIIEFFKNEDNAKAFEEWKKNKAS